MWKTTRHGTRITAALAILPLLAAWVFQLACGAWVPSLMMVITDDALTEFPGNRVDEDLERFRPSRTGLLVPLPPANYDKVPKTADDGSDLADAMDVEWDSGVIQSFLEASSPEELPAAIPEEFWLYAAHRLPSRGTVEVVWPHAVDMAADMEDDCLAGDGRVCVGGVPWWIAVASDRAAECCPMDPSYLPRGWVGHGLKLQGSWPQQTDPLRQLLALPPEQRCWRSVWAAFRLGRSLQEETPEAAIEWFRLVRELAAEGFEDSLGMAEASVGWEARAARDSGRFVDAIHLYLEHWAMGTDTRQSLRSVCDHALDGPPELLTTVALDPLAAGVMTAYLNGSNWSRPDWMPDETWIREDVAGRWIRAIEQAGVVEEIGADRAAMFAYRRGDLELAERWACLAPDAPVAAWVRAKLAIRRGDLDAAAEHYATLARLGDPGLMWDTHDVGGDGRIKSIASSRLMKGEHAVVLMALDRYTEALEMLVRGGFWPDAAYLAERVMTVEELVPVVDRVAPPQGIAPSRDRVFMGRLEPERCRGELRHLLARRLGRAGRWAEASAYMPDRLKPLSEEMARLTRESEDASRPERLRAIAMWTAAQRLRVNGVDLIATELWPDQRIVECQYDLGDTLEDRIANPPATGMLPTRRELERAEVNVPPTMRRFHYRYVAADLAWRAAGMLPDGDPLTSEVLWRAGRWLAPRDPKAADRFYKALVRRCGDTPLGEAARRARWLPSPTLRPNDRKHG
jgi:hypothetical protein